MFTSSHFHQEQRPANRRHTLTHKTACCAPGTTGIDAYHIDSKCESNPHWKGHPAMRAAMMRKNPAAAVSSTCSKVHRPCPSAASQRSFSTRYPSPHSRRPQCHELPKRCPYAQSRCYAARTPPNPDPWDAPSWPRSAHPTPYEIFGIQRGTPYNKRRFYQLVKLYHPDTHDSAVASTPSQGLSHATRLERYHLVVAANELLSDPVKRRLYDHHGIGWTDGHRAPNLGEVDREWRNQPGNASQNATWEDWERWRRERAGTAGEPMYMSNGMFATLVVCMCMIGALAQMNRAEATGEQYVDFVQHKDSAIGQKMRDNTTAAAGRTKDERVDTFLRDRENLSFDFQPGKYDAPPQTAHRSG